MSPLHCPLTFNELLLRLPVRVLSQLRGPHRAAVRVALHTQTGSQETERVCVCGMVWYLFHRECYTVYCYVSVVLCVVDEGMDEKICDLSSENR